MEAGERPVSAAPFMPRTGDAPTPPRATLLGFSFLVAALVALIELGVLDYTFTRLGIDHRLFSSLLLLSLVGSLVNLPVGLLPATAAVEKGEVSVHGHRSAVPPPQQRGKTLLAINVGGALVPACLSIWLMASRDLFGAGLLAIGAVSLVTYLLARPVRGLGIAVPVLVPPIAAAAAALLLEPQAAAAIAYAAGSLGTLIGADLLNLPKIGALGAPVVSIGGAGTFDGVFLSGVLAVLLA
jgi:uncharacterized membrane protein